MAETAEIMRYYSASATDLRSMRLRVFGQRVVNFQRVHEQHLKFQAQVGGVKLG